MLRSSVRFSFITKVAKKNSRVVVVQDRIITLTCKKVHIITAVLEEILLIDLHHCLARLARLIHEYLFSVKK